MIILKYESEVVFALFNSPVIDAGKRFNICYISSEKV